MLNYIYLYLFLKKELFTPASVTLLLLDFIGVYLTYNLLHELLFIASGLATTIASEHYSTIVGVGVLAKKIQFITNS